MTIARKLLSAGIAAAAAIALAACSTSGPGKPPSVAAKGVEGSWMDAEGSGLSTFAGGRFRTVATEPARNSPMAATP